MILDKGTVGSFKTSLFNKEYQIGCIRYYRTNVPRFLERNLRRAPSVTRCPRYLGGFTPDSLYHQRWQRESVVAQNALGRF